MRQAAAASKLHRVPLTDCAAARVVECVRLYSPKVQHYMQRLLLTMPVRGGTDARAVCAFVHFLTVAAYGRSPRAML